MLRSLASKGLSRGMFITRRNYVEAATNNVLKLRFALPHELLYDGTTVTQVNLPAHSGKIGILANHVPTVEQLHPGVVEIIEEANNSKKYFISGGFATVQPDSVLCVTAIEAFPLDSFSQSNITSLLSEAKSKLTSSNEEVAAKAQIQIDVLEELQSALK